MLFDWANQPFQTLVVTFVFAPYFAATVVGDPVRGQALWGTATAIGGAVDRRARAAARRHRRPHRRAQALGARLLAALSRSAASASGSRPPQCPTRRSALAAYVARLPRLRVRHRLHQRHAARASRRGARSAASPARAGRSAISAASSRWSLVLLLLVAGPGRHADPRSASRRSSASTPPPASRRAPPGRSRRSGTWSSPLPLFLFTPDAPARRARGARPRRPRRPRSPPSGWRARNRSFFAFLGASMLYRDALAALFTFGGIYAAGVLGWGMFQLGVFGIVAAGDRHRRRLARRPRRPGLRPAAGRSSPAAGC